MSSAPPDWWPCGCVKRDKAGNMTHLRMNSPKIKRCRYCKHSQPPKVGEGDKKP